MRALASVLTFALLVLVPARVSAHGMRTVAITVAPVDDQRVRLAIRSSLPVHGAAVAIDGCTPEGEGSVLSCPGGWRGRELRVRGLGPVASEAVVSLEVPGAAPITHLVQPGAPSWTLPVSSASWARVAADYVGLGLAHIATGADHLLFLLGLVLCLRRWRAVLLAETAFTLSHSVSFSAAALGWVHVSPRWAEATIAVSLLFVALDVGRTRARDARKLAGLAFVFGLVHGLGFAGGLRELGVPDGGVLPALIGFAAGVELGQVAFLAAAFAAFAAAARVRLRRPVTLAGAYAIGGASCFWLAERVLP